MNHSKEKHLICGIKQCDCVFSNVTTLDLHQAEFHGKTQLRIANKEDNEAEEEKKVVIITNEQYQRMAKKKKDHFPTLNGAAKQRAELLAEKEKETKNNVTAEGTHVYGQSSSKQALKAPENFPTLPGGTPPRANICKEPPKQRKFKQDFEIKENKKANKKKKVVESTATPEEKKDEIDIRKLIKESVKEAMQTEAPRPAHTAEVQKRPPNGASL